MMVKLILCHIQVISIVLDPYYSNQTEIFKSEEHHGGVKIMRLPTNLFGLEAKHKFDVRIYNFLLTSSYRICVVTM